MPAEGLSTSKQHSRALGGWRGRTRQLQQRPLRAGVFRGAQRSSASPCSLAAPVVCEGCSGA
eukprot:7492534-Alexandrium_andersonii.AAC.1